jgi:DNA polymerase-1
LIAKETEGGAIFLLDGTQLVYRAHFAFINNPMRTSKGRDVSALFGFVNTVFHLIQELGATRIAVFFDAPGPTFRHEAYEEYKATRPPTPREIKDQIPEVKRFLREAGIYQIEESGIEADDVIASLARALEADGHEVVLVGSDKDLMQLVGEHIRQYSPARGPIPARWYGPEEVEEKWGVPPEGLRDLLALVGDTSDNVPGVPGVGPKTATKLLREFGSLDGIYENLDRIKSAATRKKLQAHKEEAYLSCELITLREDSPPDVGIEELQIPDPRSRSGLLEFLHEFEFRRLEDALRPSAGAKAAKPAPFERVRSGRGLEKACGELRTAKELGLVCVGHGTSPRSLRLGGVALSDGGEKTFFVAVGDGSEGVALGELTRCLAPLIGDTARVRVGHNAKTGIHMLRNAGLNVSGPIYDVQVASYVLDPSRRHDLPALAQEFLGRSIPRPSKEKEGDLFSDAGVSEEAAAAACAESQVIPHLRRAMDDMCASVEQKSLLYDVELPLISVLAHMEWDGVALDVPFLSRMNASLEKNLRKLEERAHEETGVEFNLNSPTQLREVLFEKLKLPPKKKTKTGYSTDSGVLESLVDRHPLPRTLLEYRLLAKLQSTYVDVLPKLLHPKTKRLHATFHQTVAATGRLSSSDPNLQNIPIRSPLGREIRKAFVASPEDWSFLSADYSQIELRLLAHLSGDSYLTDAFRKGEDIHTATACRVFDVPAKDVDGTLRAKAKIANFGILYGMGPQRLSVEMGIPVAEAKKFIEEYLEKLPGVRGYLKGIVDEGRKRGYVETILGRRRYLPDLNSRDNRWRSQAERMAINTPIQGSAADLIKRAMVRIHGALFREEFRSRMVLQIHDELLMEAHPEELGEVRDLVRREMEGAAELNVPLVVELGSGRTWWDAHG